MSGAGCWWRPRWRRAVRPAQLCRPAEPWLGWRLEDTTCLGLHATPFASSRSALHPGQRLICLVRDGDAVGEFARWLTEQGFGASSLWVMEALGGPRERIRQTMASSLEFSDVQAPVAVALEVAGAIGLPRSAGLPDTCFAHDGQITKSPIRALTLAALAPRPGLHLWDIGAGSDTAGAGYFGGLRAVED